VSVSYAFLGWTLLEIEGGKGEGRRWNGQDADAHIEICVCMDMDGDEQGQTQTNSSSNRLATNCSEMGASAYFSGESAGSIEQFGWISLSAPNKQTKHVCTKKIQVEPMPRL
jgi:hypothetical protein